MERDGVKVQAGEDLGAMMERVARSVGLTVWPLSGIDISIHAQTRPQLALCMFTHAGDIWCQIPEKVKHSTEKHPLPEVQKPL